MCQAGPGASRSSSTIQEMEFVDTHTEESETQSKGRRWWALGGALMLVGVVVAGLIAASGNSGTEQRLAKDSGTVTSAPPATDTQITPAPAPKQAGAQGKGQPISLAGSSPIDGAAVDLAAFRGKPVVLQIWASWCPGCNAEAPHMAELSKLRSDVAFVGLNYRDSASESKAFYTKYGWTFPSIEDQDGEKAFGLGLQGTPTTVFLDAKHREVGRFVGEADRASLVEAIGVITGSAS